MASSAVVIVCRYTAALPTTGCFFAHGNGLVGAAREAAKLLPHCFDDHCPNAAESSVMIKVLLGEDERRCATYLRRF